MSFVADWLARRLWAAMLWFMRRPAIRRLQRGHVLLFPKGAREEAWRRFRAQERFARRHGLTLLRWTMVLALSLFVMSLAYLFVMRLVESGAFELAE